MREPRFFLIWPVSFAAYLALVLGYRTFSLGATDLLEVLLSPWFLCESFGISLTISIPIFLFWFDACEARKSAAMPAPQPDSGVWLYRTEKRIATRNTYLWFLFVFLITALPFAIFFRGGGKRILLDHAPVSQLNATGVKTETEKPQQPSTDPSTLPKYGGIEKTEELRAADDAFVADIVARAGGREEALQSTLKAGSRAFEERDADTAMRRFNQAWLISSTSADVYGGMGRVEGVRGNFAGAVELFLEALALDPVRGDIRCDLGITYMSELASSPEHADEFLPLADEAFSQASRTTPHLEGRCFRAWAEVARAQGDNDAAKRYEERAEAL